MKTCICGAPATDILKHDVKFVMKLGDWTQVCSKSEPLCSRCLSRQWNKCHRRCVESDYEFIFCSEHINKEDR